MTDSQENGERASAPRHVIICMAKSRKPHIKSEVRLCHRCGGELWISPASLKLAEEKRAALVCSDCATQTEMAQLKRVVNSPEEWSKKVSPEQLKEIQEHYRREGMN